MPDAPPKTPPGIGKSALLGALLGGGLGAGASALGTAERPNESRAERMKRILRNALVGGTLGAGAGASGGATLGMIPRLKNEPSWLDNARESALGNPIWGGMAGYGIGNRIADRGVRKGRIDELVRTHSDTYNKILNDPQNAKARKAMNRPPGNVLNSDKGAVDKMWNTIMANFNFPGSNIVKKPTGNTTVMPPSGTDFSTALRDLFNRSEKTNLGGKPVDTFVDTKAREAFPDYSRFQHGRAPTRMERAGYNVKSTLKPTKAGGLGAALGALGPWALSQLGTAFNNMREE